MNQSTIISAQGPLIPNSENYSSGFINYAKINGTLLTSSTLLNNGVLTPTTSTLRISNDIISGLQQPQLPTDIVNKSYITNKLSLDKNIITITLGSSVIYTPSEIVNNIINRDLTEDLTDSFPTVSDIVNYLSGINSFSTLIFNNSNQYTLSITIFDGVLILIEPLTALDFLIVNVNGNLKWVYNKIYTPNFPEYIYFNNNNSGQINIDNIIKTTNNFFISTTTFEIAFAGTYTEEQVTNSILTRTTIGTLDYFPQFTKTGTYSCLIRNATGSTITLSPDNSNVVFNFSYPFIITIAKAIQLSITSINNVTTVTLLGITNF